MSAPFTEGVRARQRGEESDPPAEPEAREQYEAGYVAAEDVEELGL
ncbi:MULTISPECIES: hypothetical protein [Halorhodospira]|nr:MULTISPECIES: hypothetical protein [Halorhodospira]MCG5526876.1 hypothetical protein [Halorhodospira halophila]MCG5542787.1 hypothetical protein [Halorhodospira sp. 9628]